MAPDTPADTAANLGRVLERIETATEEAGRPAGSVTLVAISKGQPADRVRPALAAGHRVFGENRVQAQAARWEALSAEFAGVRLHLVGPLQSNKVRKAVAAFDVIETVDRPKLARALAEEMARSGRRPACFVQVNTGEEPQKAGVLPEAVDAFLTACRDAYGLPVEGLMCLPPFDEPPAPHFALLAQIASRNGLAGLSMGMTADFETAIRLGATHVRIGTAIFGERTPGLA